MVEHNLAHASDASASYAYLRRDARLVKALAARMRGNWSEMRMQALAAWDLEPIKSGSKLSDFWIAHFAEQPKHDTRATLLLIDAERALGQSKDADALVEEVRRGFNASRRPYQGCRFISRDMGWRKVLYKTLGEIEARELKCS